MLLVSGRTTGATCRESTTVRVVCQIGPGVRVLRKRVAHSPGPNEWRESRLIPQKGSHGGDPVGSRALPTSLSPDGSELRGSSESISLARFSLGIEVLTTHEHV